MKQENELKYLYFVMGGVSAAALTWTESNDFIPLFRIQDTFLYTLTVGLLFLGLIGRTQGLFKVGIVVGCLFYLLQFFSLYVYYLGVFILSPDSLWAFYIPGVVYLSTVYFWRKLHK